MGPYLQSLTSGPSTSHVISADPSLLARLQTKNKEELDKLEAKLEDAQTNLGETEISDALRAKALYLARIGDKVSALGGCFVGGIGRLTRVDSIQDAALKAHEVAIEKTAGLGSKIDLRLAIIRIGFFHGDHEIISSNIDKAQLCVLLHPSSRRGD
jgi:26S proteasome regulatory subunit N7